MDRVDERIAIARRALGTLSEALKAPKTELNRDASIQRFEYSFETLWKAAQIYLAEEESLQLASPTSVIRSCYQVGLLTEPQSRAALSMAKDRNLTVHTYNEDLANEIYGRLPDHSRLMNSWLTSMETARTR